MQLTPRQRNAVSAMKMAQSRTKKQLKSQEQLKTIVTYPKGLYKKTLEKNLDKAMEEVGLPNRNSKTGSKPKAKKKSATKRKAAMSRGSASKRKDGMSAVSAAKRKAAMSGGSKSKPTATKRKSTPKPKGLIASIKKIFS